MGLFESVVEGLVQGATLGVSNLLGVTGKNGLIHDSDVPDEQAIYVDNDGLYFVEGKIQISWGDVKEIEEEEGLYRFELKGGLIVFTGWVYWEDGVDAYVSRPCDMDTLFDLNCDIGSDENVDADNIQKLASAVLDVSWASGLADAIRGSNHLGIHEPYFLRSCFLAYYVLWQIAVLAGSEETSEDELEERFGCFEPVFDNVESYIGALKKQLERIGPEPEDEIEEVVAAAFAMALSPGNGIPAQASRYDNLRNARAYGFKVDVDEIVDVLTLDSDEDKKKPLGNEQWAKRRKVIVCTDGKAALTTWRNGVQIPDVMVMDARDVIDYNGTVGRDIQLMFEPGHPCNGCTYVQHPLQQNVYFEINSFHDSLLERKQNELLRIFEALGAYSAHVDVRHEQKENVECGSETNWTLDGAVGRSNASLAINDKADIKSRAAASQRAVKDWTFDPPETPALPDNLVFYPTEETWQLLANSVLRGGLRRAEVDLEYKSDYTITEKYLLDVSASAKTVLPSFDMNLKRSFTSNLQHLTTTKWHYVVSFENESGERAGPRIAQAQTVETPALTVMDNKFEALFIKRAKRYARDGHINAEQRADLEAFAKKYGIDDFRMEELIEDAFEPA